MGLDGKTVNTPTAEFEAQHLRNDLPNSLLKGTSGMRKAGEKFLPQMPSEDKKEYEYRLKTDVLKNYFKRTLGFLAGQVFQKPVSYEDPIDGIRPDYDQEFFDQFYENVDLNGTNLSMYCRNWFFEGVAKGIAFTVTDHPVVKMTTDNGMLVYWDDATQNWMPKTAESDMRNGWRQYWVLVKSDDVLDAWLDVIDGMEKLVLFRYRETFEKEQADGTRATLYRVRVFTPGLWETWEQEEKDGEFSLVDSGQTGLDFIPVDWFMPGEQEKGLTASSAIEDLAHVNVAHWQASSDHMQLMAYVRRPVWKGTELQPENPNDKVELGPSRFLHGAAGSDLKSVGVDPNSVEKSFEDMKAMEDYMESYGLQLAVSNNGDLTATQAGIAAAASDSTLKGWVELFKDSVENALKKVAAYRGEPDGPSVSLNTEFRITFDATLVNLLSQMVDKGQLSTQTLLETMKLMGVFSDEFDQMTELDRIAQDIVKEAKETAYTPSFGASLDGDEKIVN